MLPNFYLLKVQPTELQKSYELIEPGLHKILEKSPDKWIPADVYVALKTDDSCHLFLGYINDSYEGFIVVQTLPDEQLGRPYFYLWLGHSEGKRGVVESALEELEAKARNLGVAYIEFGTKRTAWARRLARRNYEIVDVILRKELTSEQET